MVRSEQVRTFFILLNLRKPNLRSSLSQLSAPELVTAEAQMFKTRERETIDYLWEGLMENISILNFIKLIIILTFSKLSVSATFSEHLRLDT